MKKLFKVLLVFPMFLFIFSCPQGDNASQTSESTVGTTVEPSTLSIMMYTDKSAQDGRDWEALLARYRVLHPEIQIEVEELFNEPYHDKLTARASNRTLPDVMYLWPGARSSQITGNALAENLVPLIDRDGLRSQMTALAFSPQGPNGEIWELPMTQTVSTVLFTDTSKTQGYTFNTVDDLKAFAAETGIAPIRVAARDSWVMNSVLLGTVLGRLASPTWIKETVENKAHSFTDPEFIASLAFVKELFDTGVFDSNDLNLGYGERMATFRNSPSPILIDGEWAAGDINELFKDEPAKYNDIIFATFPSINGEPMNSTAITLGTGLGISAGLPEAQKERAWEFIKFFTGADESSRRLVSGGIIPSYRVDTASLDLPPIFVKRANFAASGLTQLEVIDSYLGGQANELLNTGLQEIALGAKTPEQVAQEVQTAFEAQ